MKFSVFTASIPEWTPDEAVTKLAAQGWDGVEWRVVDQEPSETTGFWRGNKCTWPFSTFEADVPRIKEITAAAGLEMPALGNYAPCSQLADVESVMRGAAALGIPRMRVPVGKPGPSGYNATFEERRAEYRRVAELSATYGVQALIELHHQSLVSSASAARRFLDGFDPAQVGVIHDIGNMLFEGYEYDPWALEILGPYLAHVHVKNARPVPDGGRWRWEMCPTRAGVGDLRRLFEALRDFGYDGWVSCEDFSTEVPMEERTADNLAYLRELVG